MFPWGHESRVRETGTVRVRTRRVQALATPRARETVEVDLNPISNLRSRFNATPGDNIFGHVRTRDD